MANPSRLKGDFVYEGNVKLLDVNLPSACVDDDAVDPNGTPISADKIEHFYCERYSQPLSTATSETRVLHVVDGTTSTIEEFEIGLTTANAGAATVTVDLQKSHAGGAFASVLTGATPVSLGSGDPAIVPKSGTITTAGGVDGDVYRAVIVATAGGGTIGTGLFIQMRIREVG